MKRFFPTSLKCSIKAPIHTTLSAKVSSHLVLVQLAVLVLLLALLLKGDDNETDKDVHHEESNDDDVDDEEDGNLNAVVVDWAHVLFIRVDGFVQQPAGGQKKHTKSRQ